MTYDWLGIAMFFGALVLLSLGYPVAFSLGGSNYFCSDWCSIRRI